MLLLAHGKVARLREQVALLPTKSERSPKDANSPQLAIMAEESCSKSPQPRQAKPKKSLHRPSVEASASRCLRHIRKTYVCEAAPTRRN